MARPVEVVSPLGPEVLRCGAVTVTEELGRPFEVELDLLSPSGSLTFDDLLGQPAAVSIALPGGARRFFHGLVARFALTGWAGSFATYRATLRPWLWLLSRTADCRIFQGKTVPEIVKQVFRDRGFTDFDDALGGSYEPREYCVQYRESDFAFVSRLLEQEGIYYFFRHEAGKHVLVLADSQGSHAAAAGYGVIPYHPPGENVLREEDHVTEWTLFQEIQPGVCALNDFDFERPKAGLLVKAPFQRKHAHAGLEVFDYPGDYGATGLGEARARTRIEELQAQFERAAGRGNPRGLAVGSLFSLSGHPRADQNREYLVVAATHRVDAQAYESAAAAGAGSGYECTFDAAPSRQPFRPPRRTPRPVVQGPQTAVVVGKAGEEIWTDRYGRVKVQFHWDREGRSDEQSSCWVRVAQVWAGKGWGGLHLPRIGQEVVVDFLEGDPDRPLVTGRVYNADNMPPYDLPANQTQAGLKSRSTKGGGPDHCNELRFEDQKGAELLTLHAERNQAISVENDEAHAVGHDRRKTVGNDETTEVKANRTETVGKDEKVTVGANRTGSVGQDESLDVGGSRTESVGRDETLEVGDNRQVTVGKRDALTVGTTLAVEAGDQIVLTAGAASLTMKKNGDIVLRGNNITIEGSGKISVKASKDVVIKGSKILGN